MVLCDSPAVQRWLSRLSPGKSREVQFNSFKRFMEWVRVNGGEFKEMDPDQLVAYQIEAFGDRSRVFRLLDMMQRYLLSLDHLRPRSVRKNYTDIRSFFMHNRAELPRDPGFRVRGDKPRVVGRLDADVIRRVVDGCNPMYSALFLCMFCGGLGWGELDYWNQNGLESVRREFGARNGYLFVDLPGRKKQRNLKPFRTVILGDAYEALMAYMENHVPGPGIFNSYKGNPIGYTGVYLIWNRRLERLGVISPSRGKGDQTWRHGYNMHEIRNVYRTRWYKSGADPLVAEFCMGHDVDPLGYNKTMNDKVYILREYRKAEPWLDLLTSDPERIPIDQHRDEIGRLERLIQRRDEEFTNTLRNIEAELKKRKQQ